MPHLLLLLLLLLVPGGRALAQADPLAGRTADGPAQTQPEGAATSVAPMLYHVADVMPAFPGGAAAQLTFLREKLRFPEEALRRGISGKVIVQFVVDEQGHLLDPKVVKGLGAGLDEEALRLVRIMPWWTPGLVAGKPVRVAYTMPIVFRALE